MKFEALHISVYWRTGWYSKHPKKACLLLNQQNHKFKTQCFNYFNFVTKSIGKLPNSNCIFSIKITVIFSPWMFDIQHFFVCLFVLMYSKSMGKCFKNNCEYLVIYRFLSESLYYSKPERWNVLPVVSLLRFVLLRFRASLSGVLAPKRTPLCMF